MSSVMDTPAATEAGLREAQAFLAGPLKMLIGETWVESAAGGHLPVENPATAEIIGRVPAAAAADVDRAVAAARLSFDRRVWRGLAPAQRQARLWKLSDLLLEHIDELACLEVLDNGMPKDRAKMAIEKCVDVLRYYAGLVTAHHGRTAEVGADQQYHAFAVSEPIGVSALILPWNGPIITACNKLAPALAAGCSVVLKPAEQTSLTALRLGELILDAGIPPGTVNIVTGGPAVGQALVDHPGVKKISFTGSTSVGQEIAARAGRQLKRVTLELGGKSPVFLFGDADLDQAVPFAAAAVFSNSGQVCFAGSRLYVQDSVYDRVVADLEAIARSYVLGSGFDPGTDLGPLVSASQHRRVLGYVEAGNAEGAELVTGGRAHGDRGYFVQPTIFANVTQDMKIAREEIFGPVLSIMRFHDVDDVARLGNDTPYGLGAGIFTRDISNAHRAARRIDSGNVWVNCYGITDYSLPFGGFNQSGLGRENGYEGIEAYCEKKAVYMKL